MSIKSQKKGLLREANYEDYIESNPNFEVKWGFNTGDGLELLGLDGLVDATLDVINPFLTGVNTFIELLDIIVDLLGTVAGFLFDVFFAVTLAIREALESVINLFTGLSLNCILHFPQTTKSRRNPDEIMYDLGMAYLDPTDPKRPITVQETFGVALVALWSLPNLDRLMLQFNRINKLFSGVLETNIPLDTRFSALESRYQDLISPKEHPIDSDSDTLYFSYKAHDNFIGAYDEYKVVVANKEILTDNPKCFIAKRDEQIEKYYVVLGPITPNKSNLDEELFNLSVLVNNGAYTAQRFIPNAMTDSVLSHLTYLNPSLSGQAPNFSFALQLTQLSFIQTTVNTLAGWALTVEKGRSYADRYRAILEVAQRRLNRIADQTQQLVNAISALAAFLSFGSGASVVLCSGTGKAQDFANALINSPLHPNYPRGDLSDINHNVSKQSSDVTRDIEQAAKPLLYSGGALLHFGVSDTGTERIEALNKLLRVMFKELSAAELRDNTFEPIGSRFQDL
tara:strand:+ start:12303 stop:13835 length:1533 start_codon:yes stop_codon:yes gene_type:complete